MQHPLIEHISKIINQNPLEDGRGTYHLFDYSFRKLGDESGYEMAIFESWVRTDDNAFNDWINKDRLICEAIDKWQPEDKTQGWQKLEVPAGSMIWVNPYGDMIHVHQSDNTIHVRIFDSGQY